MRQLASAAALAGILFYTALIPIHIVSQASASLAGDELANALEFICHANGLSELAQSPQQVPVKPTPLRRHCPFCQGLAAFQLAIIAAIVLWLFASPRATPRLCLADAGAPLRRPRPAQSRGPPSLLV